LTAHNPRLSIPAPVGKAPPLTFNPTEREMGQTHFPARAAWAEIERSKPVHTFPAQAGSPDRRRRSFLRA
jgi:hypothetical protein